MNISHARRIRLSPPLFPPSQVAGLDEGSSQLFSVTFPGDAQPDIIRLVRRSYEACREPRKALPTQVRCELTLVDPAASYPPLVGQTCVYVIPIFGFWAFQKLVDMFAAFKGMGRFKKSAAKLAAEEFGRSRARRIDDGASPSEAAGEAPPAPGAKAPPVKKAGKQAGLPAASGAALARGGTPDARSIRFSDVAGVDSAVNEFKEIINILLGDPAYLDAGVRCPRGVLLEGPPGTGKTMLATAVANEAGLPFYSASGSEFVQMFSGVAAARVRDLFRRARANAPSIIFIDEVGGRGAGAGGRAGMGAMPAARVLRVPILLRPFRPLTNVTSPLPPLPLIRLTRWAARAVRVLATRAPLSASRACFSCLWRWTASTRWARRCSSSAPPT